MLELELTRPENLSLLQLRLWVLEQLKIYGDPLRWAITQAHADNIRVEAVIITST